MRTMVKATMLESGNVEFRVIQKGYKSDRFIAGKSSLWAAIDGAETVLDRDIYSFAAYYLDTSATNVKLKLGFTFLHSGYMRDGRTEVKGVSIDVYLDAQAFRDWLDTANSGDEKRFLNIPDKRGPKVVLTESANQVVRNILAAPFLRRKFAKAISGFKNWRDDGAEVTFYRDGKYDFYFVERRNGSRCMNGGLICHRDFKEPDNFAKARYSVHT
jgi:hypothetical protein